MKFLSAAVSCVLIAGSAAAAQEVLYALNDYITPSLLKIDPATGAVLDSHTVTGQESLFGGLAIDQAGTLYSIDGYNDGNSDRLFTIDADTGQGAVVGDTGFNWNFRSVTYDATTRTLYGATDNSLFTLDQSTGAATLVTPITGDTLDQLTALVIDAGGAAYITDIGGTGLFSLDLATGKATHIGDVGGDGNWFDDLAFDSSGTLWGSRVSGGLYTIDLKTAIQTFQYGGIYRGLVFSGGANPCYPDCDASGTLDLFDFLCFTNDFNTGGDYSDCVSDGAHDLFDFLCYVNSFNAGC